MLSAPLRNPVLDLSLHHFSFRCMHLYFARNSLRAPVSFLNLMNIMDVLLAVKAGNYKQRRTGFCWKFRALCSSERILQIDQELTKL